MASKTTSNRKSDANDALAEATTRNHGASHENRYRLSSLRYWDVGISHTKRYMVAGHFVPSIRGAVLPFMSKKRRITIELYEPAPPGSPVDAHHVAETKQLFGQLLKGISSSSLMQFVTMGDNDFDAFRIMKPERPKENEDDDDDGDGHSVASMSVSSVDHSVVDDDLDFEDSSIRWKERFRCRLDTVEVLNPTGRSCDLQMGSDDSAILKTIHFESKNDFQTFMKVLEQMNRLREERARRLANTYLTPKTTPPKPEARTPFFAFSSPKSPKDANDASHQTHDITIGDSQEETTVDFQPAPAIVGHKKTPRVDDSRDPENPDNSAIQILVEIVAAYNLPIADITTSDPYVEVFDGTREIHATDVVHSTLNPVWTVKTKSLFVIKTSIEKYFSGSNFVSFRVKDYDKIMQNDVLGTVDISKDKLLRAQGERQVFNIVGPSKGTLKRKESNKPATLALRFRRATDEDLLFMERLTENQLQKKDAVYAAETFVPPRDHHMSMMKKTSRKGHKPYKEYRVKPFPDPESKLETTWLTEKEIDLVALKPSKYWIESGTGTLGKVYIEILQCDRLPNLDYSIQGRDKTDSFACIVFEDSAVNTDVITDSLSPRWMPWCQRAFVFNIMHPSSQLMVGLFDHDSGITGPSHQFVGRVVVNLCNRRAQSLYTETYVLHDSALDGRETRGTVTLRIRLEIPDGRKALVAGAVPTFNHDVSVAEREYFTVVHKTITQGEQSNSLRLKTITAHVQELQSYLEVLFFLQPALATVLLWRGHYPIRVRIPCPRHGTETTPNVGCLDRWSRVVTIHLPLHSMTLFVWGIALSRDFDLILSFLVFSIGWFFLATMEHARTRPSALYRPRSYYELLKVLVFNRSPEPVSIQRNDELSEIMAYQKKRQELKRAREEIVKTIQMEQKKYEAYIEEETSKMEEVDITTSASGGLSSITLAPLQGILLPLQRALHFVCVLLRVSNSIVVWRDSFVTFWLTTVCFLAAFILLWVPWGFIVGWIFKLAVWVFLGPWMKLVDIFYVNQKVSGEKDQQKEDLAQRFHKRYDMIVGESLARKLRKESALKMKDMKKYMFGQYLMRVPVYKEERFFDDPLPESFAEPFDISTYGDIRIMDRKYGQLLKGDMIPERQIPSDRQLLREIEAKSPNGKPAHTIHFPSSPRKEELKPLLLPEMDEDYGAINTIKNGS